MTDNLITTFAETESASGIGALGFDPKAFIIQLITFLLAYLVLRKYAFKPILKILQERRDKIESSVKLTEDLQKEQAKLEENVEKTLKNARGEADEIIANAQETARQAIREAEDKAKEKTEQIMKEAESRIATETARARKKLEKEMVGLVSEATEAIIEEKVDKTKDAKLIKKALDEVKVT